MTQKQKKISQKVTSLNDGHGHHKMTLLQDHFLFIKEFPLLKPYYVRNYFNFYKQIRLITKVI